MNYKKLTGYGTDQFALIYARDHKMPVIVCCPFVAGYLKKHPEYQVWVANKAQE